MKGRKTMFNSDMLSKLVKKAQGIRSLNNFARQCNISASTLSRIINNKNTQPPSPSTLQKIASAAHNDVTYNELMTACGYSNNSENDLKYDSNNILTDEDEKDIEKKIEQLKEDLLNGDGYMLSGNPISKEAVESLIEALSSGIRQAKIANKLANLK